MELIAQQEVRWSGSGIHQTNSYDLHYSGHPKHKVFGTGFLVGKKLRSSIMDFQAVNERLCKLRIRGKFSNITVLNIHAPTEDKPADEKETFYGEVEKLLISVPKHDVRMVLGDFNAQVGKERVYHRTVGPDGVHDVSNDNGMRMARFAASNGLFVESTFYPHKKIHKETRTSADGKTPIKLITLLSISDVRTFRGAHIERDHFLVCATFRWRISNIFRANAQKLKRFNTDMLKDIHAREIYSSLVNSNIEAATNDQDDCNSQWMLLKNSIVDAAEVVMEEKRFNRHNPWFDDECLDAVNNCKLARAKSLQRVTRATTEELKASRKVVSRTCRRKKREWSRGRVANLELLAPREVF